MDQCDSGYGAVEDSYEYGNESLSPIKCWEVLK
jgi:hypothetical protein